MLEVARLRKWKLEGIVGRWRPVLVESRQNARIIMDVGYEGAQAPDPLHVLAANFVHQDLEFREGCRFFQIRKREHGVIRAPKELVDKAMLWTRGKKADPLEDCLAEMTVLPEDQKAHLRRVFALALNQKEKEIRAALTPSTLDGVPLELAPPGPPQRASAARQERLDAQKAKAAEQKTGLIAGYGTVFKPFKRNQTKEKLEALLRLGCWAKEAMPMEKQSLLVPACRTWYVLYSTLASCYNNHYHGNFPSFWEAAVKKMGGNASFNIKKCAEKIKIEGCFCATV